MTMSLATTTIHTALAALDAGEVTSARLTDDVLARIKAHDADVGAYLFVDEERARTLANASDQRRKNGAKLGALDGIPLALKDNIVTMHAPTTAASKILEGWRSPYDATVAKKLDDAGAVTLGKLNLDEFAMGSSTENSAYQKTANPWNLACTPGGSSGGSAAAVSASLAFGALGTDTGGSIRQPAALCGVVGLKPTYGRVSRFGVVAFASSLDQVGPLTRDVKDAALLLDVIAGADERDGTSVETPVPAHAASLTSTMAGRAVGVPTEYVASLEGDTLRVFNDAVAALKDAGATVREISLPHTHAAIATYYVIATAEASSNLARYDGVRFGPRRGEERGLRALYEETRGELFGDEVKRRIVLGTWVLSAGYYDAYYQQAQKVRALIAQDFSDAFKTVDVVFSPTSPTPAWPFGERTKDPMTMYLSDIFTISCNLAGLPGISVNAGFSDDGLPIGMQFLGRPFDEQSILNAAFALETRVGVVDKRPPLFG